VDVRKKRQGQSFEKRREARGKNKEKSNCAKLVLGGERESRTHEHGGGGPGPQKKTKKTDTQRWGGGMKPFASKVKQNGPSNVRDETWGGGVQKAQKGTCLSTGIKKH